MHRLLKTAHILGFGLLFGGLAAVAVGAAINDVGRLLGLGFIVLIVSGGGLISLTKGRSLKQGWLRVHVAIAVIVAPLLYLVHAQAQTDGGRSAIIALVVAGAVATIAVVRPRFKRRA